MGLISVRHESHVDPTDVRARLDLLPYLKRSSGLTDSYAVYILCFKCFPDLYLFTVFVCSNITWKSIGATSFERGCGYQDTHAPRSIQESSNSQTHKQHKRWRWRVAPIEIEILYYCILPLYFYGGTLSSWTIKCSIYIIW